MDYSAPGSSVHGVLQGYLSGLPCLPPGDLPNPEIKPPSLKSPALAGEFFTTNATWYKVHADYTVILGFKVRTREHYHSHAAQLLAPHTTALDSAGTLTRVSNKLPFL